MVAQQVALAAQLVVLALDDGRPLDLGDLESDQLEPLSPHLLAAVDPRESFGQPAVLGVEARHARLELERLLAALAVHPCALELGLRQPELLTLAVDAQQARA